jgi:hypothetical protein
VDFTVEAELVSAVIYLAGATMSWFAWDAIGKRGMLRASVAFLVVPVLVLVGTLAVDVARSYWINVIETLVFVAGILLPVLGASRPWTRGRGLFRGEEPNHR